MFYGWDAAVNGTRGHEGGPAGLHTDVPFHGRFVTAGAGSRLGSTAFRAAPPLPTFWASMRSPTRILLVEDDSSLRDTLADVLADEGFEVAAAANGREALDRLAAIHPDLIVLDLVMPVMDGWAFREEQRKRPDLAAIPTVVLSASYPSDVPGLPALGAEAVLSKPVRTERLIGALRALLTRPATSELRH